MNLRLSQIRVSDESQIIVDEITLKKTYRYLLLGLRDNLIEVVGVGSKDERCRDLLEKIQKDVPQYILYHYECDEFVRFNDKYVLIAWIPNIEPVHEDVELYGSALMFVKHAVKIENVLIIRDPTGYDAVKLETSIQKCLQCLVDENIVRAPPLQYMPDSRGLGYVYYHKMLQNKDKVALIDGSTGTTTTYGTLLQRSVSLAINLRKKGVKYGDVIGYHANDQVDCAVVFVSTFFLGATICAIESSSSSEDAQFMFKQVKPQKVFVAPELVEKLQKILEIIETNPEIIVLGDANGLTPISDLTRKTDEDDDFAPVKAESILDTAVIVFTSGSSGVPKAVRHNHYACLYQYQSFANLKHSWDVILHVSTPQWTIYTKFLGIQILLGSCRVFFQNFFNSLWDFAKYNVTFAFFSPAEVLTLAAAKRPENVQLNDLHIGIGGNTLDENQTKLLNDALPDASFFYGYGFSEIPNGMTAFKPGENDKLKRKKIGSVGQALPGFSYKIVDPETEEVLGVNQRGEIRVQTSFFLSGYWKGDSLSLWDDYGWLKTGDLAVYDEDRCLYIMGRLKDMFKYKDYHVIPVVIEKVLRTHPSVRHAAVIGIPHLIDGHHPMGAVVLNNETDLIADELIEYVNQRVQDSYKLRAGLKIFKKLPVSANGKVRKSELEKIILKINNH